MAEGVPLGNDAAGGYRNAVTVRVRKGAMSPDEAALVKAWRRIDRGWQAIAKALGRNVEDVRRQYAEGGE